MKLTEHSLLRNWISAVMLGQSAGYSFLGTREQLDALTRAMLMTHVFESEMKRDGATVESVMEALDRKHRAVQKFEKLFGKGTWPL